MKTQTDERTQELRDFAEVLQENGFTVVVSAKYPFQWLYFEKDGRLGKVSRSSYFGFNFGTVHKPCQACGTGYSITQQAELSIENAQDSLVNAPTWAKSRDMDKIRKYKNAQDFIKNNQWAEYYILP